MKRFFFTILPLLFTSTMVFSQETEVEAPINPEHLKWLENRFKSGYSTADIPPLVLPSHEWILTENFKKTYALPAVYDLRTLNLVTSAKDQGSCGACWTFASSGSIESAMIKQGFGVYNLSEQNQRTCHGFVFGDDLSCSGGNSRKSTAYFTRGNGPVLESEVPYDVDKNAVCNTAYTPQFTLFGVNYFPNDMNIIKQAIMDYGGLYTNYYHQSASYSAGSQTYYYSGTESTNHAVLLVGWNDNLYTNGGMGAWIVKNSWGSGWGDQGYFYVAYQDTKFNSSPASFNRIERKKGGDIIHFYDELGWISSVGYTSESGRALVKYTTVEAQTLNAIGTYATGSGAVISATVYATKSGDILSGILGSTEFTNCTYSGYHRIDLISPITLAANKDFYVEVKYYTPGYNYPIPFERFSEGYANPLIEADKAWMSSSGTTWTAVGNNIAGKERDLCVRVYARNTANSTHAIGLASSLIEIFPQPAKDRLNLRLPDEMLNQNLSILNIEGQLIKKQNINSTQFSIAFNNLSSGMYLIRIENKSGNLTAQKRFIVID